MEGFKRKPDINDEVIKYIIAILLEGRILDKNDQERLEKHYEFKKDGIMKDIENYFTAENESSNSTE